MNAIASEDAFFTLYYPSSHLGPVYLHHMLLVSHTSPDTWDYMSKRDGLTPKDVWNRNK